MRGTADHAGFSLIEAIVTLVVIAIAAVGILTLFANAPRGGADAMLLSQAAQLIREKRETIAADRADPARGYAWVAAADFAANPLKYPPEAAVAGFPGFARSVTLFCVTAADVNTSTGPPPCSSGFARVAVTVTHATLGSVTADTLIADYGTF